MIKRIARKIDVFVPYIPGGNVARAVVKKVYRAFYPATMSAPTTTSYIKPKHPTQINWKVRYAKILQKNPELFDPAVSILEVGSGPMGIAHYLKRQVVGLELAFDGPVGEWLTPMTGNVLNLPFPDGSFDVVLCVDVMEHLAPTDRPRALAELIRVGRNKLIISCPCGPVSEEGEQHLAKVFASTIKMVPSWLSEHLQNGLPKVGDIFAELRKTGLAFEICGNESMIQHYGGIMLDVLFGFSHKINSHLDTKSRHTPAIGECEWDFYYSFMFTVDLNSKDRAINSLDRPVQAVDDASARVYAVYHTPWPTEHLGAVRPIYAGGAADQAPEGALTDILANEARLTNHRWSELSAYYKIWREGPRTQVVGFCHYRRLFNFAAPAAAARETHIAARDLAQHSGAFFDAALFDALTDNNTIICAKPYAGQMSIWESYEFNHNINDYAKILTSIAQRYPQLLPYAATHFEDHKLYACNMIVTSWALFDELCALWFDLLRDFEHEVPDYRSNTYQNRDISFLSERIFDIWIRYKKSAGTTVLEKSIFFVEP